MSVSPRRRGMRSTRGLHGDGLSVTSAREGKPLQCPSESAGNAAAPAQGRLLLHSLPGRGRGPPGLSRSRSQLTHQTQAHRQGTRTPGAHDRVGLGKRHEADPAAQRTKTERFLCTFK